jgi:diguanylate cyclase (GGDEF)-like protein
VNRTLARLLKRSAGIGSDTALARVLEEAASCAPASASRELKSLLEGLGNLLERVDAAYDQHDRDLDLRTRSLELTSEELVGVNERLREDLAMRNRVLQALREAAATLLNASDESVEVPDPSDVEGLSRLLPVLVRQQEANRAALAESERRFSDLYQRAMVDVNERTKAHRLQGALHEISNATHSAADLPEMLGRIHGVIGELLPAENCFVALYDETSKSVTFPYFIDEHDSVPSPRKLGDGGLTDEVLRTGNALLVTRSANEVAALQGNPVFGTDSLDWLGVPLKTKNRTIGVLAVQSYAGTVRYTEVDKALLQFVSDQVAAAIERKQTDNLIWQQANFDALTRLPNRRMFRDRLEQNLKKCKRDGGSLAILFIDLDRFKEVNDTLGHDRGDTLLVEAARRIRECVRDTDTVARFGGDEFTIALMDLEDPDRVEYIAGRILACLSTAFRLGPEKVFVTASVGITLYPRDATQIEDLFRHADQALYAAKSAGRNRFSYFTPELQVAALTRMHTTNDLRGAIEKGQLSLHYQPIVELATGSVHKAEALIRWHHPLRGLIGPADFIPLAEASGLILEIGAWVFREVTKWMKGWRDAGHGEFQVSINQSPREFQREDNTYSDWVAHLQEVGLPGGCIAVEITEGLLLDASPEVKTMLLELRDAGIEVAIDDFGVGYSSLSYLKNLDIDYLKIDQTFTRNILPGSSDLVLSEAIIVMAHKLGLKVIAEGVETAGQRDLLIAVGCDYAQGYLFARPMPEEAFEEYLGARVGAR